MILPDVNVLVYAADARFPRHEVYRDWLNRAILNEVFLLPDAVASGVLRVVTNPRITSPPVSMRTAVDYVAALRGRGSVHYLKETRTVWERFAELCEGDPQIRGKLVSDAYLAAVALAHGARIATRDRGFARFPGLRWFDPAAG